MRTDMISITSEHIVFESWASKSLPPGVALSNTLRNIHIPQYLNGSNCEVALILGVRVAYRGKCAMAMAMTKLALLYLEPSKALEPKRYVRKSDLRLAGK